MRQKSTGKNIVDTERTVLTENKDGSLKTNVIQETYAKVTIGKK